MANYVLLERIELNATTASVTFSNIPQTGYTDLKIVGSVRTNVSANYSSVKVTLNGSASGYSNRLLYGDGSSAASANTATTYFDWSFYGGASTATANTFGNAEIYIPNYTSSNNKSISSDSVGENNATNSIAALTAGLWSNTAAITSITFTGNGGDLAIGSTFSLYGVAALGTTPAIAPKADGGNVVATDGTYWYHAFLSSGTFTPQANLTADVLTIAGGGSGSWGSYSGGAGGAGGYVYSTSQSLTSATSYTCTVGAGAAIGAISGPGINGSNSQFAALTAAVGGGAGGGGGPGPNNGFAGGSGGGGASNDTTGGGVTTGGAGTAGQGFAGGGNGNFTTAAYPSGGGGGAGAVGLAPSSSRIAGNGGAGLNTWSAWATATGTGVSGYYAGGGGGSLYSEYGGGNTRGVGGAGGGGDGAIGTTVASSAGVTNTGSGGGGGGEGVSGAGGSGIIIIRYPVAS